jgi:RNA polymerase sigma-70 factor (ECF subfamily)
VGTELEIRRALTQAMDRYADGDEAAFADVYDLLAPRLYAFFLRQTASPPRAEDLVQQTLLQMHAARMVYARSSDVFPWAFAIGRRLLIDSRRRTKKEVLFSTAEDDAAALDLRLERFEVPEGVAISKELAERAEEELERMPESHREAYLLVRREGLSIAQAAEALGTTQTAVKLRAHRAYEALREVLAQGGLDET